MAGLGSRNWGGLRDGKAMWRDVEPVLRRQSPLFGLSFSWSS
jgi:hypothetical protein